MSKKKYPNISEMPYYGTAVPAEKSQGDVIRLLKKYGIKDHQWTSIDNREYLRFIFKTTSQGKEVALAVHIEVPVIKAYKHGSLINIPRSQAMRLLFFTLKSLLEATKYGLMKKEELFFSYIMTQLPDGRVVPLKDVFEREGVYLLGSFDPTRPALTEGKHE